jgi:hypothetical protein
MRNWRRREGRERRGMEGERTGRGRKNKAGHKMPRFLSKGLVVAGCGWGWSSCW